MLVMKKFHLFDLRILWGVALIVVILLMMDFNTRLGEMLRLNDQRTQMGVQVTQLAATQEYLQNQIAYATSDIAVQQWAREEGHMVQKGDVHIIPIPAANVTPQPVAIPTATVQTVSNWQVWQALFFGQ
jgi:cell division protein FtsB